MNKILKMRKRGYDLMQISIGVIVILGGMVAGLLLYGQITVGTDTADLTRRGAAISSEVRGLFRTEANFDDIDADADYNATLIAQSGISDGMLANVDIITGTVSNQEFELIFSNVNPKVCARMDGADDQLGPNSSAACDAANSELTVVYSR